MAVWGDGVDAPRRHLCAKVTVSNCHLKEASVEHITTIGLDIAKHVFHAHGADAAGQCCFASVSHERNHSVLRDASPLCRRDGSLRRFALLGA